MQHVIDFILELDKLKSVTRKTKPTGLDRYENSAEHSWQIALLAASMAEYAREPIEVDRVVQMLLIHDLGEIDTGDTIFYAEEGLSERKAAERHCVTRIFGHLPAPHRDRFMSLWEEFEDDQTPEARFAHACDRAMPVILNLNNNLQSWRENRITHDRVVARVGPVVSRGCPALWEYLEARLKEMRQKGWFDAQ